MSDSRLRSERGAVFIFAVFLLSLLIGICGLVVDLARMEIISSQLQNAADAAALAGVSEFRPASDIAAWQRVKKSVLAALSQAEITGLDSTARSALLAPGIGTSALRFNSGIPTPNDLPGYANSSASAGNLAVTVTRGLECEASGRHWFPLEQVGLLQYCKVNTVEVQIQVSSVSAYFARVFGWNSATLSATSRAQIRFSQGSACVFDACSTFGDITLGSFVANPVCP